ncbi:MAG: hypothetical protein ABW168_16500 [Sedimenticola sp.]
MAGELSIRAYEERDEAEIITLWQAPGLTVPWNEPRHDIQYNTLS